MNSLKTVYSLAIGAVLFLAQSGFSAEPESEGQAAWNAVAAAREALEAPASQLSLEEVRKLLSRATVGFIRRETEPKRGVESFLAKPIGREFLDCSEAQRMNASALLLMREVQNILSRNDGFASIDLERLYQIQSDLRVLGLERLEVVDRQLERSWHLEELTGSRSTGTSSLEDFDVDSYLWKGLWHKVTRDGVAFEFDSNGVKVNIAANALTACFGSNDFRLTGKLVIKSQMKLDCQAPHHFEEENNEACQAQDSHILTTLETVSFITEIRPCSPAQALLSKPQKKFRLQV